MPILSWHRMEARSILNDAALLSPSYIFLFYDRQSANMSLLSSLGVVSIPIELNRRPPAAAASIISSSLNWAKWMKAPDSTNSFSFPQYVIIGYPFIR